MDHLVNTSRARHCTANMLTSSPPTCILPKIEFCVGNSSPSATRGQRTLWTLARPLSTTALVCEGERKDGQPAKAKPYEEREELLSALTQLIPDPESEAQADAGTATSTSTRSQPAQPEPKQPTGDVWESILDRFVPPLDIPTGDNAVRYALPRSRSELAQAEQESDRALLASFDGVQSDELDAELSDAEAFLGGSPSARTRAGQRPTRAAQEHTEESVSEGGTSPDLRKFLAFDPFDGTGPSPRASGSSRRSTDIDAPRARKSDRPFAGSRAVTRQPVSPCIFPSPIV